MEKLNVAIADDNEKMLDLLGNLINEDQELELVGHASNGAEIYDIIKEKEPDVVLLDIIMPKGGRTYGYGTGGKRRQSEKTPRVYRRICSRTGTDHRGCFFPRGELLYPQTF